jgi:hypothetical protein
MWLELAPLLELMYHIIGIQKMKTHIFIGMIINLWILFGVIKFNEKVSGWENIIGPIGHLCYLLGHFTLLQQNNSSFLQCLHRNGFEI